LTPHVRFRSLSDVIIVIACDVTDIQVNDVKRPARYEQAIKNKESAREDIEVALNERPQKITEATTELREAETQARIILDRANSEARITLARATANADGIYNEYVKEAETYKMLVSPSGLGFNTEGFLSYLGVRTIADARNHVYVGMKAPAKPSYTTP